MAVFDVLVVGGSGRVGASTLRWLDRLSRRRDGLPPLRLAVGGRDARRFEATKRRLGLPHLDFVPVELGRGPQTLAASVRGAKLVVHTAGPFQGCSEPDLLHACIEAGVPYCDVCDEFALSRNGKILSAAAAAARVPAVLSCGIWPGVSALMAATAAEKLGGPKACDRIELSFHTAGSGGAGPTIISATFLLLASDVLTVLDGVCTAKDPWTERRVIDFGRGVGKRACFLLDNPDVPTTAEALGIANCSSRFGTAPEVWNNLFGLIKTLPGDFLRNRAAMQAASLISMPIIRAVDVLVGATNAMRVDAYRSRSGGGSPDHITLRCTHSSLVDCVGQATAAFGMELLRGKRHPDLADATIEPGVWYPAELQAKARRNILKVVRENALVWEM